VLPVDFALNREFRPYPNNSSSFLLRACGESCERIRAKNATEVCPLVDDAVEASSETPIQQFERVASPVHTIFLLVVLAVVAALGYFSVHRQGQVHQPRRPLFYLMTMAWEWLLVGYIYWGLRRRRKIL
jgi:hypothetical protein